MQLALTLFDPGVLRHWATCRLEPLKPPTRVCTSHMPMGVPEVARLYSIRTAPACAPWVLTMKSESSTSHDWPALEPTRTTVVVLFMAANKDPRDMITGYDSPTILAPGGMVMVDVTL